MKQKRKVKNLFSEKSKIRTSFLSHLLIILSCLLCVGAVSLFSLYVSAAEQKPIKYGGVDDNLEVVYGMSFSAENNLAHKLNEIYMSGSSLYMTQNSVIVNSGTGDDNEWVMYNDVTEGVYGNILGGVENKLDSDNVTIIAGESNTIYTGNQNATVLGGKGNEIKAGGELTRPVILVGGHENKVENVEGVNAVIGGKSNEISNYANSSTILGGQSNKVYGKNAIIGGSRINIGGSADKVFVFSDGYDNFAPTTAGTFYLNVSGGLGINTEANTGSVGTKGSVMIGEIDIDTQYCQETDFGVQGIWDGCLVGCTQKANQEGEDGKMWELLTYTQKCKDQCEENPHCMGEILSGDEIENPSFCTTGMYYTGNATMCNSNALQGYINVIFETNIIDSSVDCPTDGDNKCVYRCNEGAHLTGDQTGKGFGTGCYRDCQLPWSTDVIRHNQMITGYNMEDVYCSNDDGVHDDCLSHAGKMMCVDGTLYLVDESNHPTDYTAEGENFTIGVCNLNQYQCNVGEGGYNLVGTWIIGPGRDDIVLTTEDRSTVYGVRGIYHKCIDYSPKVPDDGTCQEDDSHYQLIQCQPGYATGTSYPYECRKKCTFEGVNIYKDGEAITGYKASLVTCPNVCEGINLVCNDGVWNGDATTYNHLNCVLNNAVCSTDTYPVSQSIKDNYGAHSVYSTACTPYRADGNLMCEALENRYTLINCDTNYHTEPGHESWNLYCVSNSKQLPCTPGTGELKVYNTGYLVTYTWDGGWNAGSWTAPSNVECPWTCVPDYEPDGDECVPIEEPFGHLTLDKRTTSTPANGESYALGETITYKIEVRNDGTLTITNIDVTDELADRERHIDSLEPGAIKYFTTSYVVKEQDIINGEVVNVVTATGDSPDPDEPEVPVVPGTDPEPTEDSNPSLDVDKRTTSTPANGREYSVGETITYIITVTNNGNLTISNITLTDTVEGYASEDITSRLTRTQLKPGETATATYSHVVTNQDASVGSVKNNATADGDNASDDPTDPGSDDTEDPVELYLCTGIFTHATFVEGSAEGVTVSTPSTLYATIIDAGNNKCAWVCDDGYRYNGTSCVYENRIFNDLDVYFLKSNGTIVHNTISDRNLGATAVYNQNYSSPNKTSYGYYYQWGNNWGFPNQGNITPSTTNVNASAYGPNNYYSSSVFIGGTIWDSSYNGNIWGAVTNTSEARQGPCPEGYHVPSRLEWESVVNNWKSTNTLTTNQGRQWASDLLLPFAGVRESTHGSIIYQDSAAAYWSSDKLATEFKALEVSFSSPSNISENITDTYPNYGNSVRCFKNTTNADNLTIYANGGKNAVIAVDRDIAAARGTITALGTPTKDGATFEGWYSNSGLTNPVQVGDDAPSDLYAKWSGDQEFEDLELYFLKRDGTIVHETMMDRNMGATEAGVDSDSYGYYYKWGNNQGFSANDPAFVSAPVGTWTEGAQGPCPAEYHVPTTEEWESMYNNWSGTAENFFSINGDRTSFFLMPLAGWRDGVDPDMHIFDQGENGHYRSSSIHRTGMPSFLYIMSNNSGIYPTYGLLPPFGHSIRCFKNITNPDRLTIHPNGGTRARIAIDGNKITALRDPVREGRDFKGWYSDAEFTNRVRVGDDAPSDLYAKWSGCDVENTEINDLEVFLISNEGDISHYMMMDRNLGATAVYNKQGNDGQNASSQGCYFQWGNNHAFSLGTETTTTQVNPSSYGPGNYYYGSKFYCYDQGGTSSVLYTQPYNYHMWGGGMWRGSSNSWTYGSDGTDEDRQGPCPTGYHVPRGREMNDLLVNRRSAYLSSESRGDAFAAHLLMPYGRYIEVYCGWQNTTRKGGGTWLSDVYYTSSQNSHIQIDDNGPKLWSNGWNHGMPVRCVKNNFSSISQKVTIHPDGGTGAVIAIDWTEDSSGIITTLGTPTKANFVFEGWYTEPTFINRVTESSTISNGAHLYAKWGCDIESTEVNDLEVFLITDGGNISHYMMMDRNLGATEAFNQDISSPNESSYGCYFQWGNNYPFNGGRNGSASTTSTLTDTENYGPGRLNGYYYNSTRYCAGGGDGMYPYADRSGGIPLATRFWGGGWIKLDGNTYTNGGGINGTDIDRQGPCPAGYHIPRGKEMENIMNDWKVISDYNESDTEDINLGKSKIMASDLLLPFAGWNGEGCGNENHYLGKGTFGKYLISDYYKFNNNHLHIGHTSDPDGIFLKGNGPAYGYSMRCVKNNISANQKVTIHPDGGTKAVIAIDWTDGSNGVITKLGTPTKENSVFEGWYTDSTFTNRVTESYTISNGTHLYANWLPFGDLDVYFLGSDETITHDTIMDRNLGATAAYNQNYSIPNIASYGYYYQWGNNYGFPNQGIITTSSEKVNASGYGPGNWYNSPVFINNKVSPYQWDISDNKNLWGDTINTDEARQGPCPTGYHVPSRTEWENTYNSWNDASNVTNAMIQLSSDLLLPLAGFRDFINDRVQFQSNAGAYWSSSPYTNNGYFASTLYMRNNSVVLQYSDRPEGQSLRCFKNTTNTQTLTIDAKGGKRAVIAIDSVDNKITALGEPIKEGYTFGGWYSDPSFSATSHVNLGATAPTHLYAKWVSNTYLCEGAFGNAHLVPGSDENLTGPTTSHLYDSVAEAGDNKCAWVCDTGYHRVGQACIQNPYQCEGMFVNATLVAGSDQNLTANTTSTLYATVVDAGNNKCAYVCDDGYRLTNGICVAENQIVKNLELYFLESNGTINHTTLMDRNLGATEVYNQNYDSPNTASYGYYYQWGNNRGFDNQGSVTTSSEQVDASGYGPGNYYSSAVFIIGSQWDTSNNENLWGEVTNTFDARQGPCPSGYHVPSNTEWKGIYDDWNDANIVTSDIGRQWASDFLMPFVGYRGLSSSSVYSKGSFGKYWSSKAKSVSAAYSFTFDSLTLSPYNEGGIANGYSVRCFKNAANAQTLTIHANSGTNAVIAIDDGKITALGEPIREGHTFGGWYSDPGFSTTSSVHVGDTAPTHLYAKWAKNVYNCVGTFANATQVNGHAGVLLVDVASTLYDTILEANEHQCSYVCNSCYQKIGNSCSLKNYTITYDVDGGSPAISNDTVTCGGSTLLAIGPTKAGYTFTGWKSSVTNQVYSGGVRYTPTSNVTMTAQWIDCMNYITYYANGGTLAYGTTNPTAVRCGNSTTLAAAPSRTCYTFTKWKNSANSQLYSAGINFSPNGNTTMSAQWNPVIYTLTYNCNGGNGNPGTQTGAYGDIGVLKNGGCEKANNTLVGWSLNANGSTEIWGLGAQMSGALMNTCTNKILYAMYQENPKCTITFEKNGGVLANGTANPQEVYCGNIGVKPANPTKNGATFAGWYSNVGLTSPYDWGSPVNTNIKLYAKWNDCTRTIHYVLNGGSMPSGEPNPATVQCGGSKILPTPSRVCYNFDKWLGSGDNTYSAGTSFSPTTGDVTLRAKWTPKTYTLSYSCDGGVGNPTPPQSQTHTYGQSLRLRSSGCTKTGYNLVGWSLSANSSTPTWGLGAYSNGDLLTTCNTTTLHAVYVEEDKCMITFDSNGGSAVPSQTFACGGKGTRPTNPTKQGHTFINWYDDSSFTTVHNWNTVVNSNIILHAKWTINTYTATISATPSGYGSVSVNSVTDDYGTEILIDGNTLRIGTREVTATPNPTDGNYVYKFDSWTNNCGDTLMSACTIKANFSRQEASATFMPGNEFNKIIKSLAGYPFSQANIYAVDENITSIVEESTMPDGVTSQIVSSEDSLLPIYAWYNNGTLYYYTEANKIYLNQYSSFMFSNLQGVTTIPTNNWDASKVTSMYGMFDNCTSLESLNLNNWNTSNVTEMSRMFYGCSSLTSLTFGTNWNTSNVTGMHGMFNGCSSLTSLNVSNWNTSNVTDMSYMFDGCISLTSLTFGTNWNTSNVTDMSYMFVECRNLTSITFGSNWNTSNVTDMHGMFKGCKSLTSLNVSNWNTSNVTDMSWMFADCESLASLNLSNWNTSKVTDMGSMFRYCGDLMSITFGSNWNTSNVMNMSFMFTNCKSLTSLNISNWNTSKVTNMQYMFNKCSTLTNLNLSNWNTSNVTNMRGMFADCESLTSLVFGTNWSTSNVTDMAFMFAACRSLTSINVSNWNTSNVTNMQQMFFDCSSLTSLDVSNWNVSNVTNMGSMFSFSPRLRVLDLSNWNTSKVTDMGGMFTSCNDLETIYTSSNFKTSQVTFSIDMFLTTYSLVGGNGTAYDYVHHDKEYARIDRPGIPGYFTAKP